MSDRACPTDQTNSVNPPMSRVNRPRYNLHGCLDLPDRADLPGLGSLKQKRSSLKSLAARLHREFNVSAAEVGLHDVWQSSTLGVAVVSTAADHGERVLESAVAGSRRTAPT